MTSTPSTKTDFTTTSMFDDLHSYLDESHTTFFGWVLNDVSRRVNRLDITVNSSTFVVFDLVIQRDITAI